MALLHRDKHVVDEPRRDWPSLELPEWSRRWLDIDDRSGWLRTEEFHEGDTLVVRAEMPGLDPDKDIEVSVAGGVVTIRAHREERTEQKNKRGYRSEFRYGEFLREVAVPEGTSVDDIKANYADGILEVRLPCPAEKVPESKKVPVSRS